MKTNIILVFFTVLILSGIQCNAAADNAIAPQTTDATASTVTNLSMQVSNVQSELSEILTNMTNAAPITSKYFHAEIGTVLLNPYSLSPYTDAAHPGSYELKSGNTDVRGMIQIVAQGRYAWRNSYYAFGATNLETNATWGFAFGLGLHGPGSNNIPWLPLDGELEAGYAFGSSAQGSSTAGAGDFYASADAGLDLFTYWHPHKAGSIPLVWTIGVEGFGNLASDSTYSLIHTAYGGGVDYVAGIPWQNNKLQLKARVGYGRADAPDIIGTTTDLNPEVAGSDGLPEYKMKNIWDFQAELRVPLALGNNQYGYLSFGGETYQFHGNVPDQWSTYAAVSFDLSTLTRAILTGVSSVLQGMPQ